MTTPGLFHTPGLINVSIVLQSCDYWAMFGVVLDWSPEMGHGSSYETLCFQCTQNWKSYTNTQKYSENVNTYGNKVQDTTHYARSARNGHLCSLDLLISHAHIVELYYTSHCVMLVLKNPASPTVQWTRPDVVAGTLAKALGTGRRALRVLLQVLRGLKGLKALQGFLGFLGFLGTPRGS